MADKEKRIQKILSKMGCKGKLKSVATLEEATVVVVEDPHDKAKNMALSVCNYPIVLKRFGPFPTDRVHFLTFSFERYGGDYGNVNYVSRKIENLESIGARSLYDLCLNQLQSFFIHVFSTILHECPHVISSIEIKAKLIQAKGGSKEQDFIEFFINNPRNNAQLFSRCSVVQFYVFDDDIFRADKPFYIIVELRSIFFQK